MLSLPTLELCVSLSWLNFSKTKGKKLFLYGTREERNRQKTNKVKAEKVIKLILFIFSSKHSECVEFHRAALVEWEATIVFQLFVNFFPLRVQRAVTT